LARKRFLANFAITGHRPKASFAAAARLRRAIYQIPTLKKNCLAKDLLVVENEGPPSWAMEAAVTFVP